IFAARKLRASTERNPGPDTEPASRHAPYSEANRSGRRKRGVMARLSASTRIALRGAVATGLAIALTAAIHVTRPYWLILVAVILVNQTWGASVARALQ